MRKRYVLLIIVIISVVIFSVPKSYANNKLDEVGLNKKVDKELFAIMLDQGDGTYKESDDDAWPKRYTYNAVKSGCMDINGNKITDVLQFDDTTHVATVNTSKTVYCYLYFDREKDAPVITDFYIGSKKGEEYINKEEVPFYLKWDDEDVEEYCITEDDTSTNCTWHKTNESEIMVINNIKEINGKITIPTENRRYVYHVYIKDDFNNVSTYGEDEITLDTTINDISKVYIGGNTNNNPEYVTTNTPTVYIEWPDSDIVKYCVTTSTTCTPNISITAGTKSVTTSTISLGNDGTKTVNVVIEDRAGNTKNGSDNVIVDTTKPIVKSVSMSNLSTTNNAYVLVQKPTITVTFDNTDIASYCISLSTTCTNYVTTGLDAAKKIITVSNYDLGSTEGSKTVRVWLKDKAGLTSVSAGSVTKTLDLNIPTISTPTVSGNPTTSSIVVTGTSSDANGISGVTCSSGTGTCTCSGTTSYTCTNSGLAAGTAYTITVTVKDNAGRSKSATSASISTLSDKLKYTVSCKTCFRCEDDEDCYSGCPTDLNVSNGKPPFTIKVDSQSYNVSFNQSYSSYWNPTTGYISLMVSHDNRTGELETFCFTVTDSVGATGKYCLSRQYMSCSLKEQ